MRILSMRVLIASGVAIVASSATRAGAQLAVRPHSPAQVSGGQTGAEEPAGGIGDIVVTARREVESGQRVPVTVSAFTGASLRQANIVNATDIMNITSGVSTQGTGSSLNAFYSIRGVTRQITGNGQPGVISYFAEVPLPNAASNLPFFDMANVQVLKGPQGTLFGRNTVGGALLFYPAKPSYDLAGYLDVKIQNYDGQAIEGAVNLPIISDKVAVRIAGQYDRQDGYARNLGTAGPARLGGHEERAMRASLLVEPVEGLRNTTIFDYDKLRTSTPANILRGPTAAGLPMLLGIGAAINPANPGFVVTTLNGELALQNADGPRVTNSGGLRPVETARRLGVANRSELDLSDDWSLINILGYRSVRYVAPVNLDGSVLPLVDSTRSFKYHQTSDEIQIHGSLLEDRVKMIFGGFYLKSKPSGGSVNDTTIFFQPNPQYTFQTETSKALFANVSFKLDELIDGLRFSAGYRHTWDKQSICSAAALTGAAVVRGVGTAPYDLGAGNCEAGTPGITNVATGSASSDAPGWTSGLDWQANRSLFLYAVTRRGYRSGGVNNPALGVGLAAFQTFKPETNTDIEVGAKSDWRIGGLIGRFNLSGFYSWQKGVQVAFTGVSQARTVCIGGVAPVWIDGDCNVANNPASGALTLNTGNTRIRGIEAELVLKPIREITLSASGTLLDPSITKTVLPASPVGGVVAPTGAFPFGQFLNQNLAKRSLTASARFDAPLPARIGDVSFNINYYCTSKTPINALIVPSYNETSLRLDWNNVFRSAIDVGVFARNVFDQENIVAGSFSPVAFSPFLVAGIYNKPRIYGLQARARW